MVEFRRCQPEHLLYLDPVAVQTEEHRAMLGAVGLGVLERSIALSAWHDNRCVGVAGLCPIWSGRAEAWALLGTTAHRHVLPIVKHMAFVLDREPYRRVEMLVKAGNNHGHRLAKALGFVCDTPTPMQGYAPDGTDYYMYARIRR